MVKKTVIAAKEDVYYTHTYWNDFPYVQDEINRRTTGTKLVWYDHYFKNNKRRFKKILILNCGNGWLERDLYGRGYIDGEVVGVDYSADLLKIARKEAKTLPGFSYYQMDTNTAKFPGHDYDLVINMAGAHHIAYINRVFCSLLKIMTSDAVFLNYDYIGPHRNQYPLKQWLAAWELNEQLPPALRQDMQYPHLPTMLASDPSEAIHSELILETAKRYFNIDVFRPAGGALAYLLITHNSALFSASPKRQNETVRLIMDEDKKYSKAFPNESLFAYWIATPKKSVLKNKPQIAQYQRQENLREQSARKNGGLYYKATLLQKLYLEISDLKIAREHRDITIGQLQKTIAEQQHTINVLSRRLNFIYRSKAWRLATKAYRTGFGRSKSLTDRSLTASEK